VRGTAKTVVVDTEVSTKGQGNTKLSPVDHSVDGILDLVQKGSNTKKKRRKFLLHGSLKIGPSLPLKMKKKENQRFFIPTILRRQFSD
jgi:hypothetical protein